MQAIINARRGHKCEGEQGKIYRGIGSDGKQGRNVVIISKINGIQIND